MNTKTSLAKLNRLERQIVKLNADADRATHNAQQARSAANQAQDAAEAVRWEQAEEVWSKLKANGGTLTQQQVAAGWANLKTGKPYTQQHVNYVAQIWDRFGANYNPGCNLSFEDAYRRVKTTPNPAKPRKPRAPSHQSKAASAPKGNLPNDPMVVAWVGRQRQAGKARDAIIAASRAEADGWPRPGVALSKATLTEIERSVKRGTSPATASSKVRQARQREASTRMQQIAEQLQVKNAAIRDLEKINLKGLELSATLYHIDLTALANLNDPFINRYVDSAFDNLVNLHETIQLRIGEFTRRASDKAVRDKLDILRNPSGRTAPEHASACAIADEIERKHFGPRGLPAANGVERTP